MTNPLTIGIEALGALGDGVAEGSDGMPIYVPFALPGETWSFDVESGDAALLTLAPDRTAPRCPHYMECGGCLAQHMPAHLYLDWKRELVQSALDRAGITCAVDPLVAAPANSRRRATLTAWRRVGGVALGFHARGAHHVVDIEHCAILSPAIAERLEILRELVRHLKQGPEPFRLMVVATRSGLSVDIQGAASEPDAETRAMLADIARRGGVVRLGVNAADVVEFAPPDIDVDGVVVRLPDHVFLQASAEAEAAMVARVTEACGKAKRVADLFSGIGTFALALTRTAHVSAFDSEAAAIAALEAAHKASTQRKPVAAKVRDLFREPLSRKELEPFDAVVFDPPRAGAKDQAASIARSDVPTVVGVSCNPATFARDARVLVDGGYSLETVTPIDQFVFSEHVELIAVFRKPARRKRLGQRR